MFKWNPLLRDKGFTIIELMVVVAIIGILAAIAIPRFNEYRLRAYNTMAQSDVRHAFKASQAYFSEYPTGKVNLDFLKSYGFQQSENVFVYSANFKIESPYMYTKHVRSKKYFIINNIYGNVATWP